MKKIIVFIGITLLLMGGSGCSKSYEPVAEEPLREDRLGLVGGESAGSTANYAPESDYANETSDSVSQPNSGTTNSQPSQTSGVRMIIKNGELTIRVEDIDLATENAIQTILDYDGYIISQSVNSYGSGASRASLRFGVPSNEFEATMRSLRALGEVSVESASGQDVTDEYVDLNSQLENLELTQLRLRTFLEEAENTEEALQVHQELRKVEGEIAIIQGRLNYLQDRSSFSTISLELTTDSSPIALGWQPSTTVSDAFSQLKSSVQDAIDFGLYYGIVCLPWLLILGLVALVVRRVFGVMGWRINRRGARMPAVTDSEDNS